MINQLESGIKPTVQAAPMPGFSELTRRVTISPEEREIGNKSKNYFDRTLKRITPWSVKPLTEESGRIVLVKAYEPRIVLGQLLDVPSSRLASGYPITGEDLQKETVSPRLASVMFTFKRIEDKLADFTGRSSELFRNIWGINNSYTQWSAEELQHSDALGMILTNAQVPGDVPSAHFTRDQLQADYQDNLGTTWEPPFETAREMVLYAAFQEQLTSHTYRALGMRATEEGAPNVAEILNLIAHDESYHGGGYRAFSRIYAGLDIVGTIRAALHVGMNFRMPAQNQMRDQKRDSVEIARVGAFSKDLVSEETIYKVLKGLGFVPENLARMAADAYWSRDPVESQARVLAAANARS